MQPASSAFLQLLRFLLLIFILPGSSYSLSRFSTCDCSSNKLPPTARVRTRRNEPAWVINAMKLQNLFEIQHLELSSGKNHGALLNKQRWIILICNSLGSKLVIKSVPPQFLPLRSQFLSENSLNRNFHSSIPP